MIKLTFTGVGSAFNPTLYNTSCYYKEGNKLLLIDCGADTFRRLSELCVLDNISEIYVCVTHTHQDHIGSLGTLIAYCSIVSNKKITLILDEDEAYRKQIFDTLLYAGVVKDIDYKVKNNLVDIFKAIDNVSFFDVNHAKLLKSKGYIFYLSTKELFIYSGDSNDIEMILNHCKDFGKYKFIQAYVDCNLSWISTYKDTKPHEFISDLLSAIPKSSRKLFTTMHYDSYKCRKHAKDFGFNIVYHCTEFESTLI